MGKEKEAWEIKNQPWFGEKSRAAYAIVLLHMEQMKSSAPFWGYSFDTDVIKERLVTIMSKKQTTRWMIGISLACVLGVGICFVTSAKPVQDNLQLDTPTSEWVIVHGYPVNENGETYGPDTGDYTVQNGEPDLILAQNEDGVVGYIRKTEMDSGQPSTPEEAVQWESKDFQVNMYLQDGVTKIGLFQIGG